MRNTTYSVDQVNSLPPNPGIYKYYNAEGQIIYVGKAKNLKKRVQSYFLNKANHNLKTRRMVAEIKAIEIAIVNSENDALLLENNLIKAHQPRYNILLKDDKSYPYILITNEPFPRIFPVRNPDKKFGTLYGPYASIRMVNAIMELFRELFHVRTCKLNLTERSIAQGKFDVCLEYHIGKCLAPCVGKIDRETYMEEIDQAAHILKGRMGIVKNHFKEKMQKAAETLEFEEAERYKQKMLSLENYQSKSVIVNPRFTDIDTFTIVSDEEYAYLNYLNVDRGAIRYTKTVSFKKKLDESDSEILQLAIVAFRDEFKSQATEILSNIEMETFGELEITVPKIGDKRKLVELSVKNAMHFKKERLEKKKERKGKPNHLMDTAKKELRLDTEPTHIECFDNSNIQGTNPVASMVCFKNGKPSKKDYRKFKIKTVVGPDDFRSMYEIVTRRYKRLRDEEQPFPNLIVIDGGKGQLSFAVQALKDLGLFGQIPIIGIAKRLEELYYPEDPVPLLLNKKSETLKMLQHARDEAHRFAITFHRDLRSKNAFGTALEHIKGIGPSTAEKLLKEFKSVKNIEKAGLEEISKIVGEKKARTILDGLAGEEI
ncbi:UvrABC system protein C [Fulvitalea axinellae]|uniref:UvrABC system protein C n=1 Tax=Fulvitalea axinellae TaxID=1182444 RepID=A0AAU9CZ22_9BACT|nr:UvrABC system protein C [Fulvitalea axinellae]